MYYEALDRITDLDVLRQMVLHREAELSDKNSEIADREALLVEQQALVREQRDALAQRDAVIAKRDHAIHFKTAKIDHLSQVIKNLQRLEFAMRSQAHRVLRAQNHSPEVCLPRLRDHRHGTDAAGDH